MKITANSTLAEIIKQKGAEKILMEFGLPCLSCPMAQMEMPYLKLGDVCQRYNLNLKEILLKLNKLS